MNNYDSIIADIKTSRNGYEEFKTDILKRIGHKSDNDRP